MWEFITGIVLKIPDMWEGRTKTKVNVTELHYGLFTDDSDSALVFIIIDPSRYYAKIEFAHSGKAATIKTIRLNIDKNLDLEASHFKPFKLEHGDYRLETVTFSVDKNKAIKEGTFKLTAITSFDKKIKIKGRFPVREVSPSP